MTERDTERLGGGLPQGRASASAEGEPPPGPDQRELDDQLRRDLTKAGVACGMPACQAADEAIKATRKLRAAGYESAEIESLRAKLAACETAARGAPALPPDHPAWSTACQAVQELRAQLPPPVGERKGDE